MESCRPCKSCGKRTIVSDDATCSLVCASCGIIQEFDDLQHHFGGLSGPTGTFVRTGTAGTGNVYHYKETKLYRAKETLERITSLLDFWPSKTNEVRVMVETITEGEYGQGDWLPVLIGACAYVVMRNDNKPLPLSEVADKVSCDIFELGRMVNRVVDFLELKLPEFNIVNSFQWVVKTCFDENLMDKEKIERILKQGIFLMQCLVKWYLTTGRRPIPVVVAVLVFVAQLNEVDVQLEDIAKEFHVAVRTCKLRYKELLNRLVKVAQALPWGKDINVKNIIKNAGYVIQYMELKSMSKHGEKRKSLEHVGFDLDGLVRDCLSKEVEFGMNSHGMENDSQYFEVEDPSGSPRWSIDDLEKLKISYECLSLLYSELSNEVSDANSVGRSGSDNRRKRGMGFDVLECREWWKGKSELSKKLFLKQILEKDVGLNALPPSFVSGCLAYQRRREKIKAAKVRIDKIMCPPNANSSDRDDDLCILKCVIGGNKRRRKKIAIDVDWEDFIIETLLLHRVEEEEIEKGHYNTLLGLHVFNSGSM
ncbi:plant-specific TFIIB-related protein PTF2-like [Camellia sinensis]|uniref:plant-specific TFIIB-related protein PTF2-like n=1 Tax=Camellia sinensis TaxID=4442 RepID=UPI0010365149|nr:plant-specific TFIIB-related protein PTF2-like [Camellia sinensis]XP_028124003.1 plant-specific TFIIB-related protein PTF2-like [Camellia sinensis]XP_028124004.1 plant-specific TFIIB-related protein PTF2-like [Camellia sinensis]XP_028124006.1 plant-specific TFIIB-related protein PTF2-like [Camellia sinensis]XP_028124007.1 plant-specific TFIIB-related protein PTF2-like [Camellia sinensis]XP_028124008.1 plant-specific TFIIB-related protein PTF2-like [Camellia sinensis]XP_028124009.1 plant-sp